MTLCAFLSTLCDNLRRERDRAVSDLADALRNLDDMRKQKNDAARELKELKCVFPPRLLLISCKIYVTLLCFRAKTLSVTQCECSSCLRVFCATMWGISVSDWVKLSFHSLLLLKNYIFRVSYREKLDDQLEKEARYRQLMAHSSHDSAIDTDSMEWETEVVELEKHRVRATCLLWDWNCLHI